MKTFPAIVGLSLVLAGISTVVLAETMPVPDSAGIPIQTSVVGPPINFGTLSVGSLASAPVSGVNNTPAVIRVWTIISGPDSGEFSVVNNCADRIVIPSILCTGTVTFHPSSPGVKNAMLVIVARGTWGAPPVMPPPGDVSDGYSEGYIPIQNSLVWTETIVLSGTGT
ncbi:hypothetical protein [Candidatus Aalborgicola defluviihabitans]|uniref:hypothetical protein n=1 Tax=Candidatus Aalborgicola defluviihabitans TaxID=3386187 RepID=UPI001EC2C625|nr:hypothetical protein [Burkholderiales bacterium]